MIFTSKVIQKNPSQWGLKLCFVCSIIRKYSLFQEITNITFKININYLQADREVNSITTKNAVSDFANTHDMLMYNLFLTIDNLFVKFIKTDT